MLTSVVGIPLIPSIVAHAGTLDIPVNTGLQDGSLASVTVDADPLKKYIVSYNSSVLR